MEGSFHLMKRLRHQGLRRKPLQEQVALIAGFSVLVAVSVTVAPAADKSSTSAAATFRQYCVQCHGDAAATAGINLERLISEDSVSDSFKQWEKVAAVLDQGQMPPEGMPQPSDSERAHAAKWIHAELSGFAAEHAGEPGRVTVRRLTSGEYAYTVRDLTGLDLGVERDFAGDAVGGEGFTNFGGVQFMADANVESYLEAAKRIADHAVIGAGPLSFYQDPGMSGFELSAIHRIHDIYRKHGFRAVAAEGGRAFGLERYGRAFYASWRYSHREALGEGGVSLEEIAAREDLSPRFIQHIWSVLQQSSPTYPTSEVVSRWKDLPAPSGAGQASVIEAVRERCDEIQRLVINWPRELFAAGELAAGGAGDERALVITDESLAPTVKRQLSFTSRDTDEKAGFYLSIVPVNPASSEKPVVVWRNPTIRVLRKDRSRGPEQTLKSVLDEATTPKLTFGRRPDGGTIGPNDFATEGEALVFLPMQPREDALGFQLQVDVEVGLERSNDAVMRCTIADRKGAAARTPVWALLADPQSEGFKTWKRNVLEYAANLPQTSHGEPTPSDRDPVPKPFDNTYNQPERDSFHYRVKYFRNDQFLVDKMLDDATRQQLEDAWSDLHTSFQYHDEFVSLLAAKYSFDLDGKGISELTESEIEVLPAGPRPYVRALRAEQQQMVAAQMAAHPGHIEDAIRFASRAWRRPLSPIEKDSLRSFYTTAREEGGLDHRKAIRALLTRILVAPAFLYRLEQPEELTGVTPLSDWELANRLSYFLWSSVPDEELRRAAEAGELSDPQQIQRQVKRMLADPKARRLATEFFGQWLGFYRFDRHRGVDTSRFPEFTEEVKAAMYDEAVSFFEHVIREDRPVREIVSANYTFLNRALATHYGIEREVASADHVEKVEGVDEFQRGGLLRLGAVLTATSAPLRTSPVKRGDWVLRRVLGTPTPTPPADAGSIPADEKLFGGLTVREQLEAHRSSPSCMSCHTRIDPLGFPLEQYDAVGRWRTRYAEGQAIDAATTLGDGTRIDGVAGLIDHLENQERQVLRTLSSKLLGYALGRTILLSDQPLIDRLVEAGGQATFAELAAEIAVGRQFRYRRGREDTAPDTVQSGAEED